MAEKPAAPPPLLRIVHAIVFLGFASAAMAATHAELQQLWRALTQRYHAGTPPDPIACASGLLAGVLAVALVACVGLGRKVPLAVSALLLLSFAGSLTVIRLEPKARTVPGANLKCLDRAKALHGKLNEALQKTGRVPSPEGLLPDEPTPFYRRPFTELPWKVEKVKRGDVLPDGAEPGGVLVQTPPDAASFVITGVGIDEAGEPSLLRQQDKPIEYRGAYNPDTPR